MLRWRYILSLLTGEFSEFEEIKEEILRNLPEQLSDTFRDDDNFDALLELIETFENEGPIKQLGSRTSQNSLPHAYVSDLKLYVNVKKSTLLLSAVTIDALITSGFLTAALSVSNDLQPYYMSFNEDHSLACNFSILMSNQSDREKAHAQITKQPCSFPEFDCRFREKETNLCDQKIEDFSENFSALKSVLNG